MLNWVEKLLDIIVIGNDQFMVKGVLVNFVDWFDFVGYVFVNICLGQIYVVFNYDIDWQRIYDMLDYWFIDLVMWQVQLIRCVFVWFGEVDKSLLLKEQKNFFLKVVDFNICLGVFILVVIVNGVMFMLIFVLVKFFFVSDMEIDVIMVVLVVVQFYMCFEYLWVMFFIEEKIVLMLKQVNYICWLLFGKIVEVIVELEQVKYVGVCFVIDDVRMCYNLVNYVQLVVLVI